MEGVLCVSCIQAVYEPTQPMTGLNINCERVTIRPSDVHRDWTDVRFAGSQSVGWEAITFLHGNAVCAEHAVPLVRGNLVRPFDDVPLARSSKGRWY